MEQVQSLLNVFRLFHQISLNPPAERADVLRLGMLMDTTFRLVLEIIERSLVEDTVTALAKLHELGHKAC